MSTALALLEIDLPADPREACIHDGRRPQPGVAERLEIALRDIRVHQVEDVDADLCPRVSESQNLGDAEIDLVDPIAEDRLRWDEIYRDAE